MLLCATAPENSLSQPAMAPCDPVFRLYHWQKCCAFHEVDEMDYHRKQKKPADERTG